MADEPVRWVDLDTAHAFYELGELEYRSFHASGTADLCLAASLFALLYFIFTILAGSVRQEPLGAVVSAMVFIALVLTYAGCTNAATHHHKRAEARRGYSGIPKDWECHDRIEIKKSPDFD